MFKVISDGKKHIRLEEDTGMCDLLADYFREWKDGKYHTGWIVTKLVNNGKTWEREYFQIVKTRKEVKKLLLEMEGVKP